jgi:GNAT superfamily N-acetyltransferase
VKRGQSLNDHKAAQELKKAGFNRRHPFNPNSIGPEHREAVDNWVEHGDYMDSKDWRDKIPRLEGPARERALHRLHGATQVRRNAQGEREFLLHRGLGARELAAGRKRGSSDTHFRSEHHTSWSPHEDVAHSFAEDKHIPENLHYIVSAWVKESDIHHIPKAIGSKAAGDERNEDAEQFGRQNRHSEHEIIVRAGHKSYIHGVAPYQKRPWPPKPPVHDIHDKINVRAQEKTKAAEHAGAKAKISKSDDEHGECSMCGGTFHYTQLADPHDSNVWQFTWQDPNTQVCPGCYHQASGKASPAESKGAIDVEPSRPALPPALKKGQSLSDLKSEEEPLYKMPGIYDIDDVDSVSMNSWSKTRKPIHKQALPNGLEHRVYGFTNGDPGEVVHELHADSKSKRPLAAMHVAMPGATEDESFPAVEMSIVHPKHKGKGLGRQLYLAAISYHGQLHSGTEISRRAHKAWQKISRAKGVETHLAPHDEHDPSRHMAYEVGNIKTKRNFPPVKLKKGMSFNDLQKAEKKKVLSHDQVQAHFDKYGPGQTSTAGMERGIGGRAKPGHTHGGLPHGEYELQRIRPSDIYRGSDGTQHSRARFEEDDEKWAKQFADRKSPFPAIIVKPHPERPGKYQVLDGATRSRAAHIRGDSEISAYVHKPESMKKSAVDDKLTGFEDEDQWYPHVQHLKHEDRPYMGDLHTGALGHLASDPDAPEHKDHIIRALRSAKTVDFPMKDTGHWESHGESLDDYYGPTGENLPEYKNKKELFTKHPIIVGHLGGGRYKVLDGQHRFNQAKKDGKSHIKTLMLDVSHWTNRNYHK